MKGEKSEKIPKNTLIYWEFKKNIKTYKFLTKI